MEVSLLSQQGMNPLSRPLQVGVSFFHHPLPALLPAFPRGELSLPARQGIIQVYQVLFITPNGLESDLSIGE